MQNSLASYRGIGVLVVVVCVYVLYKSQTPLSPSYQMMTPSPLDITRLSPVWFRNNTDGFFKIIVLTQRRHWSLKRLLESLQAATYSTHSRVTLEIRIDFATSDDHAKTIELANNFNFTHGPKNVIVSDIKQGLIKAWFNAWTPASETERAIILEDDMELSPLWYMWIQRAWAEYGDLKEIGGISLCRQRLNATSGAAIFVESDSPFLYRMFGTFGYSPNARYWRGFVKWARNIDLNHTDVRVPGVCTTDWWENGVVVWEQYWIWWYSTGQQLYTLYVHSTNGALVTHWQEPGEHSNLKKGTPSDKLFKQMEPVLQKFPSVLVHYGWNFRPERYNTTNT